ncbi:MAG TPA: ATP-binding protein [Ramlibacter sp.]|nr:ATP-binding protein [Ramlibacter sp.]
MTATAPPDPGWRGWLRACAVVLLCTAVSELMTPHLDLANIIMVYLAGVVYVALHEGPRVSVAAVVASIFLFDLIFVPPRWGLNPLNPSHFFTFAVMLAVGLLISHLAAWARGQTALAEGRAQRAQTLSELSAQLAAAVDRDAIGRAVAAAVQTTFGWRARLETSGAAPSPGWGVPLRGTSEPLGMLVVEPGAGQSLAPEDRSLLEAFAHQAALALERCAFEQKSADAMVEAETERLRNTLLSGISHDFRTPLTTIVGAATTLLEQGERLEAERRAQLARGVLGEARRLHELVSDLLDLTRLEEGAVQLHPEWCPVDDLVEEALAAVGERARSHDIRLDLPADAIVWCDARLVEQALVNIVDNALRHTPQGTVVNVQVRVQESTWQLVVSDNGPGLPKGREQEVLRKFVRGQAEPAGTGFGLGLAICAAVAKLHGGTMKAGNANGARFTLTLPQPPAQTPVAEEGA